MAGPGKKSYYWNTKPCRNTACHAKHNHNSGDTAAFLYRHQRRRCNLRTHTGEELRLRWPFTKINFPVQSLSWAPNSLSPIALFLFIAHKNECIVWWEKQGFLWQETCLSEQCKKNDVLFGCWKSGAF